jgi:magnesium transporter
MSISPIKLRMIRKLLPSSSPDRAVHYLSHFHPADVAEIFADLRPGEISRLVEVLMASRRAGETLRELPEGILRNVLQGISNDRLAVMIGRQTPEDALTFFTLLSDEQRQAVEALLPREQSEAITALHRYPEGSAGKVMSTGVLAVSQEASCEDAVSEIRRLGRDLDAAFYLYVVDREGRLTGVVPMRELILSPGETPLRDLMRRDPISARAFDDQERVADLVAKYNLLALPIIDDQGRLLGAVTVDDVIDVIHEEATEDFYHMAGLDEADRVFSPVLQSVRRRLIWTAVNIATAIAAAMVVGLFEGAIDRLVALAVFMPVVAGLGGNSGTQSLTVMIRGIALRELEFSSAGRAVLKQAAVGLLVGLAAGSVTAGVVWLWKGNPWLGLVLFGAMLANMTLGALAGASIPLLLRALCLDPALGSGIIVTAVTDSFGFFCFLGLAALAMSHLAP